MKHIVRSNWDASNAFEIMVEFVREGKKGGATIFLTHYRKVESEELVVGSVRFEVLEDPLVAIQGEKSAIQIKHSPFGMLKIEGEYRSVQ